jgi:hypothetical protein
MFITPFCQHLNLELYVLEQYIWIKLDIKKYFQIL